MIEGQLRSKIGYMSEPMCFCTSRYCQVCEESHKIVKFNMKPWYANNLLAYISSLSVGLVKSCRLLQRRMHHRRPISLLLSFLAFSPPPSHVLSSPLHALSLFLSRWSPPSRPLFLLSSYVWHSECLTERPRATTNSEMTTTVP